MPLIGHTGEPMSHTRHFAFYEALSQLDERSVEWRETATGLAALRLCDGWTEDGTVYDRFSWGRETLQIALAELPKDSQPRGLIGAIAKALQDFTRDNRKLVLSLLAYARSLDRPSTWSLLRAVCHAAIESATGEEDGTLLCEAALLLAHGYRAEGLYDQAFEQYAVASSHASVAGEPTVVLRAQIGAGQVALQRGDRLRAAWLFEDVATRAASVAGCQTVQALASLALGELSCRRREYATGLDHAHRALELYEDPLVRQLLRARASFLSDTLIASSERRAPSTSQHHEIEEALLAEERRACAEARYAAIGTLEALRAEMTRSEALRLLPVYTLDIIR